MFKFLQSKNGELVDFFADYIEKKHDLTELALEIGIGRIADVIAKCGFRVIANGEDIESVKSIEYRLNVKPNVNQNATDFWKQAVYRAIRNPDGCVIINMPKQGMYIAESWQADNQTLKEKKYSSVSINVDGDIYQLNKTFKASDVVHLRYSNPRLMHLLLVVNNDLNALYNVAEVGYSTKAPKVKVSVNSGAKIIDAETGKPVATNQYAKKIAEQLTSSEIKSIVAHSGIDVAFIESKTSLSAADIRALKDEVFNTTAMALGIPKSILFGDVANQANSEFITYACEPIMAIIDNAVNGAWLTEEEYSRGNRIIVNKLCVKHIDVIDAAGNLDKLYQNGWSHNDIMQLIGQPEIDEPWANERRFTKNYSAEGGEKDE